MKRSVLLITVVALLLLTAGLAPLFKSDPGLVLIHFRDWTIEMSVLVLVAGVVVIWLLAQLLMWLFRLPAETARKVGEKRALVQLEKGLLALTEGDWKAAERALQKSANTSGQTTARYLAAAQAADGMDAEDRRDYYLDQADSGGKKRKFLVELTRARMLMANGRRAEALPVLQDLYSRRKSHPQVLELLSRCYQELGHWEELQKLMPVLRKNDVLDDIEIAELQINIAREQLSDSEDADALQSAWNALPKTMRREASVVEVYAERAGKLKRADLAESVLRTSINKSWNQALVLRYGDPGSGNSSQRLQQCEKWLKKYPQDPALHMALGRLCAGEELWGKARTHLIKSLEIEPTAVGYDSLGQLLERQGELELAMACFRNALRMTQGRPPEPLPSDVARLNAPDLNSNPGQ